MNEFAASLLKVSVVSAPAIEAFAAKCNKFQHPTGFELVKAGTVCNYLYFVEKGLVKVYYQKDDKQVIDWFADEGNIISAFQSFLSRKPGIHTVKLLEPSQLIGIRFNDLEELFGRYHDLEHTGRLLVTRAFIELQERINSIQFQAASERYDNFIKRYPGCINRISLGDVASYLGITQVTLSRIRAQK